MTVARTYWPRPSTSVSSASPPARHTVCGALSFNWDALSGTPARRPFEPVKPPVKSMIPSSSNWRCGRAVSTSKLHSSGFAWARTEERGVYCVEAKHPAARRGAAHASGVRERIMPARLTRRAPRQQLLLGGSRAAGGKARRDRVASATRGHLRVAPAHAARHDGVHAAALGRGRRPGTRGCRRVVAPRDGAVLHARARG